MPGVFWVPGGADEPQELPMNSESRANEFRDPSTPRVVGDLAVSLDQRSKIKWFGTRRYRVDSIQTKPL